MPNGDECQFCHEPLESGPENLTFLDHVAHKQPCEERYEAWMAYMHQDFIGY